MITLFQLQKLTLNDRAQYIWDHGRFIESKTEDRYSSNLYWMGNFYAEVVYNSIANKIEDIVLKEAFHNN